MPGTPSPSTGKSPKPGFAVDTEERQVEQRLLAAFNEMDIDGDGKVSKDEFRRYIATHPQGWPLADLLDGQTKEVKDQMITFWFRKLDVTGEGVFNASELLAFFNAMNNAKYKEAIYADFLLNLFDKNFDGNLSQQEFGDMMEVLLGPKARGLAIAPKEGLSRSDLVQLLHRVHCDFNQMGEEAARQRRGGGISAGDIVVVAIVVGAVAAAAAFYLKKVGGQK